MAVELLIDISCTNRVRNNPLGVYVRCCLLRCYILTSIQYRDTMNGDILAVFGLQNWFLARDRRLGLVNPGKTARSNSYLLIFGQLW